MLSRTTHGTAHGNTHADTRIQRHARARLQNACRAVRCRFTRRSRSGELFSKKHALHPYGQPRARGFLSLHQGKGTAHSRHLAIGEDASFLRRQRRRRGAERYCHAPYAKAFGKRRRFARACRGAQILRENKKGASRIHEGRFALARFPLY